MEENQGNIRFLSIISYLGVLFVIGHFAVEKENPDLRFHTFQGGVMFAYFTVLYFFDFLAYVLLQAVPPLQTIVVLLLTMGISAAYVMLMAMGMASAWKNEQKLLPYVGPAAVKLRLLLDRRSIG